MEKGKCNKGATSFQPEVTDAELAEANLYLADALSEFLTVGDVIYLTRVGDILAARADPPVNLITIPAMEVDG